MGHPLEISELLFRSSDFHATLPRHNRLPPYHAWVFIVDLHLTGIGEHIRRKAAD